MRPERTRPGSDPGHVSVVGGGLAGLAAAVELADAGADVTLYESRARLGGATYSFERNGLWLDNGQHVALRCCTAYLDFLRRIGSDHLLPLQRRLDVPVLREGRPAASISRIGAPAPLHLAPSLLTYAPLSLRERAAAVRAALALKRLDPDDAALDAQGFGDWLRSHGQTANAITALWNLIALPTLNLPADEASLAGAVKVFRTGLLDSADAADIGIPAAPFQQLHADPAKAAIEERGGRILLSSPVRADDLDELLAAGPVVLGVPPNAAAEFVPVDVDGLGASPIVNLHVHYDRNVLDVPLAAALGSPVQFVFDRTAQAGARDGQLLAVSLSHAVEEIEMSVASLRDRYLPALERLFPSARAATVLDFAATHEPRATFRAAPGTRRLRPGPDTSRDGLYLAGAWTDTGWPATMESAVRSGLTAARAVLAARPREQVAA
jgi:squalene-associated FAD-dependent desaturase